MSTFDNAKNIWFKKANELKPRLLLGLKSDLLMEYSKEKYKNDISMKKKKKALVLKKVARKFA